MIVFQERKTRVISGETKEESSDSEKRELKLGAVKSIKSFRLNKRRKIKTKPLKEKNDKFDCIKKKFLPDKCL